ncbi:MAG: cupin domain-containing protein [Firmicutes bacterium]|jgi:mannose-6-phosphate isomerase-like protein (cupin superfamily)|nr:cupin domain-containing protein [Bacillota bacterium]
MLKRANEMQKEIREQMRGGKGCVEITHIFQPDELKGACRLLAKLTLAPGCSIGRHVHTNEEEVFYVVSGTALVDNNGTQCQLGPGDALLTGGGQYHAVENAGSDDLVIMAIILLYPTNE